MGELIGFQLLGLPQLDSQFDGLSKRTGTGRIPAIRSYDGTRPAVHPDERTARRLELENIAPMNHAFFMKEALTEAKQAFDLGEFPVGCVIVHDGKIIASGSRQGTAGHLVSETDHAEILALRQLEQSAPVDRSRLTLYCTLEPCLMCFGAILISGIRHIVFAYEDVMGGGTRCDLGRMPPLYSSLPVTLVPHILRDKSLFLLKSFFSNPDNTYWKDSLLAAYTLSASFSSPS